MAPTSAQAKLNRVVIAVKQVPDTTQVKVDPVTGTLIREGVPFIVNPFDTHAVEAALSLKDRFGCPVTAITMGPPNAVATLRRCLALGVDDAILISDRAFGGADTLATSYVLAEVIRRLEKEFGRIDVVICGKQTIDGDTAQVGPGIAQRLNLCQLTLVDKIQEIDPEKRTITVRRKLEGRHEVVQAQLPAEKIGLKGSPTSVMKIFAPQRAVGEIVGDGEKDPEGTVQTLIKKLIQRDLITF